MVSLRVETSRTRFWRNFAFRQFGYPSLFRGYSTRISRHSWYFPTTVPWFGVPLSSTGSSPVARSPASSVLSGRYDSLPSVPPHFVAFVWWYHGSTRSFRSRRHRVLRRTGLELVTRYLRPGGSSVETTGPPKFLGNLNLRLPMLSDPGRPDAPDQGRSVRVVPARDTTKTPTRNRLSGLNRMAFGLAVYVSRDGYPPNRARLASRCWSGSPGRASHPQGSTERFQTRVMLVIPLSQACLAQASSLFTTAPKHLLCQGLRLHWQQRRGTGTPSCATTYANSGWTLIAHSNPGRAEEVEPLREEGLEGLAIGAQNVRAWPLGAAPLASATSGAMSRCVERR